MKKHVLLSCICLLLLVSLAAVPVLAATVSCPSSCSCLLPDEAKKLGSSGYCGGRPQVCGSDDLKNAKYCYAKPVTTAVPQLIATGFKVVTTTPATVAPQKCTSGCTCLSSADGKSKGLLYCGGKQTLCGDASTPKYCFALPTPATTQPISLLITGFHVVTTTPASFTFEFPTAYCGYPCSCYNSTYALTARVTKCANKTTGESWPCGYDEQNKPMYCYRPDELIMVSENRVTPVTSVTRTPACSAGCSCLLPDDATKKGLSYCGGKQTTCTVSSDLSATGTSTLGPTRYCYTIPVATGSVMNLSRAATVNRTPAAPIPVPKDCPAGCSCLEEKTIHDKGYSSCSAAKTECGYSKTGGVLYCAKTGTAAGTAVEQPSNIFSAIGTFLGSLFGGKPATEMQGTALMASFCQDQFGPDYRKCDTNCVNIQTDDYNCGGCGNWCNTDPGYYSGAGHDYQCINGQCILRSEASEDPYSCGSGGFTDYDYYTSGSPGVIECPAGAPCLEGVCSALGCLDPGLTACNNICTRTSYDNNNCGSCGIVCLLPNQSCRSGACHADCDEPGTGYCRSFFDGSHYCAELDSDGFHCGTCQHSCPSDQLCSKGECVEECPVDRTRCGNGCVNTMTSEYACGGCGNRCDREPSGDWAETCVNGECRDPSLVVLPR